ncbi:MAG TPA: FAD-dependent oxidoreductase [Candidatus Saccharimonadales bacterium]|nr:FAD-dependent oxidoreductase [Candidatus Saccharimonadales bacterium]
MSTILKLNERQPITPTTEGFWFRAETPLQFRPGQFLRWNLPHDQPDERGTSRFFSIASAPTEPAILLATKFNAEGSSFKRRLSAMQPGETVEATGPLGGFILPDDPARPVVLVAGGIGVTPFRSMLKMMADSNRQTPTHLLYGSRTASELAFKTDLDQWASSLPNLAITYVVAQPDPEWPGQTGNLDAQRILDLTSLPTSTVLGDTEGGLPPRRSGARTAGHRRWQDPRLLIYLSGPQPMIEALKHGLLELGVAEEQIKTDYFPGYTEL